MLTGHTALLADLKLEVPAPYTESRIAGSTRRSEVHADKCLETFPKKHLHAGTFRDHLRFALKNEPTDLGVLHAAFKTVGPKPIRAWALEEPTGVYARKAWFLYEFLTGDALDLPNAKQGNHADVLNPKQHIVATSQISTRHRMRNNLLGVSGFCLTVRRTQTLVDRMAMALDKEVAALAKTVDPDLLRRAISYLNSKETKSTFEIEGEVATPKHEERFVTALSGAATFDFSDKAQLLALQNAIVDPRYAAKDWRDIQVYVGQTARGYREVIHLVCPKPEDVSSLMSHWTSMAQRLLAADVDAAIVAALVAFPFVFIHPFEDGNGRIHRFLIHNILAKTGFSPDGIIFPVSAAIVRDMRTYDAALERFSRPLLSLIDWRRVPPDDKMVVSGKTDHLYRYFDATPQVEFLYEKIAETIHKDLMEELEFIGAYDDAYKGVRAVVDMPNKKISLFVKLTMQNEGRLPKGRRRAFAELTNKEIAEMEAAVQSALHHVRLEDEAKASE
jgi:hypothetical protein